MEKWGIVTGTIAVTVMVVAVIVSATSQQPLYGIGLTATVLGLIWLFMPRREDAIPRRYIVFLAVFAFSAVLPQSVGLPLQIVALVGAFLEWLVVPAAERRGNGVVLIAGLFVGFWAH